MSSTEMDHLNLPKIDNLNRPYHHSSQPEMQSSKTDFPSSPVTAVAASSSSISIAIPHLSINRMAYSLSNFNQQFRRVSQLSDVSRVRQERPSHIGNSHSADDKRNFRSVQSWLRRRCKGLTACMGLTCQRSFDLCGSTCAKVTPLALCNRMVRYLPALQWMTEYQQVDTIPDILVGVTIAVFHVPESMGYSFLADVNPVFCLYSSFFPTLIYGLMGTSQYCSVGTFAALSIMTGGVIKETKLALYRETMLKHSSAIDKNLLPFNSSTIHDHLASTTGSDMFLSNVYLADHSLTTFRNEDIAFACTFLVGLYLLLFGILRLGFISVYMSEQFLNGFTCAVAYHVLASQIPHMLGLPGADTEPGQFILFQYLTHIYKFFNQFNLTSFAISILTCALILFSKLYIDPWLVQNKKLNISFPIEFIVVMLGVAISRLLQLSTTCNVKVVGSIQTGLPEPIMPAVGSLLTHLWRPCFSIAIVSFAITYSVGRTFYDKMYDSPDEAAKEKSEPLMGSRSWEIDPSQELFALGCSNLLSSFFSCIPSGASLSRSALQFSSGGRTQLVSIINCAAILAIIYMSSLFETLPKAILATIISVALRNLLASVKSFRKYWKISKVDASVWIVTFLSVMIININYGLFIGLVYSMMTLIYKSQRPPVYLLGSVHQMDEMSSLDFFVPLDQYVNACELPGIKIFQFCGPLHFANVDYFLKQLEAKLNLSLKDLLKVKTLEINLSNACESSIEGLSIIRISESQSSEEILDLADEDDYEESILLSQFPCFANGPFCSTLTVDNSSMPPPISQKADIRTNERILSRCRRQLKRSLPSYLIIDCSMFSYIDTDGLKMLRRLVKDFVFLDVKVFLGGCPSHVGRLLEQSQLDNNSVQVIYISVPDAIEHARQEQQDLTRSRSIMALNEQVFAGCIMAGIEPPSPCSKHQQPKFASVPLVDDLPVYVPPSQEPLSSLFSSVASTYHSLAGDSVIQQMDDLAVLELPYDDCHSLSIEEEVNGGGDNDSAYFTGDRLNQADGVAPGECPLSLTELGLL